MLQPGNRAAMPEGIVHNGRHRRPNPCGSGYRNLRNPLARSQEARDYFFVTLDSRPPSAEEYREKLNARRTIAMMNLHRGLAERAETDPSPSLRAQFAERYRELIGVAPNVRGEFRAALERIDTGGGMPVQDVIDLLRMRHSNGFAGAIAGDGVSSD